MVMVIRHWVVPTLFASLKKEFDKDYDHDQLIPVVGRWWEIGYYYLELFYSRRREERIREKSVNVKSIEDDKCKGIKRNTPASSRSHQ
ncbi:uncharacterized protein An07g09420 [Aspergillus niger]|uniref:Contig An07c0330, genomic contig n=2 Tax=Aspergillus niger TaxID=5061 RepID=A2QPH1_ASPNC|nr:uncharacterized protein An07g09420 [Aspergillus niger]CAK39708.1 unnamed protein product [Aspergillus niger]